MATGGGTADAGRSNNPFQHSVLSLTSATGGIITGLAGQLGEMWAVLNNGRVYRRTDGGFGELAGFSAATGWADVYVAPDGAVFLASAARTLRWCLNNCTSASAFSTFDIPNTSATLDVVCGTSATNVFAVARRDQSIAILYHWNGTQWTLVSNNLGLVFPQACFMRPDGTLFIGGRRDIVRWEQGAASVETASLDLTAFGSSVGGQVWWGLHGTGTAMMAVGGNQRALVRDDATATWAIHTNPSNSFSTYNAVGLTAPNEAFAAGNVSSPKLYVSDGGPFAAAAVDLPAIGAVNNILVVNPNELYFGGYDNSGPVIIRSKR